MILRELYQIGQVMKDDPDWPTPMYEERKIRWEIWLDEYGQLRPQGISWFDPKDKEPRVIDAPDLTRSKDIRPYLVVDKPEYVLGVGKDGKKKHDAYMKLLELCADETNNQAVRILHAYLSQHHEGLLAKLKELGLEENNDPNSTKPKEWIHFKVADQYPIDDLDVRKWWADYARDETDTVEICCIGDIYGKTTRTFPASVKINSNTCKMASVDAPASKSYGFDKTDHAPMTHDAALIAGNALKMIVGDKRFHRQINDTYYGFWTREPKIRTGLLAMLSDSEEDAATISDVRALFDGVFDGSVYYPREDKFFMFVITNTKTRIVIRASIEASLATVVNNVRDWFESIELNGSGRGLDTLNSLHFAIQVSNKRQNRGICMSLVKRAFFGMPLDRVLYASIFPRIEATIRKKDKHGNKKLPQWRCPSKEQIILIKLYLSQIYPEVKSLVALREDYPDIAYHYGRLMAAYESIQLDASPNVQSTVTERFFSSMMINPKRTIAKLDVLEKAHMRKGTRDLGMGWAVNQNKRLESINNEISAQGAAECNTFTLDQRGMFVLGYWHEKFRTFHPISKKGDENDVDRSSDNDENS